MTEHMTRQDLVEALAAIDVLEQHAAVKTLLASAASDEAAALEVVLDIPEDIASFFRREQAIGELRAARNVRDWLSDWKRAAVQAVHEIDNNKQTNTHEHTE